MIWAGRLSSLCLRLLVCLPQRVIIRITWNNVCESAYYDRSIFWYGQILFQALKGATSTSYPFSFSSFCRRAGIAFVSLEQATKPEKRGWKVGEHSGCSPMIVSQHLIPLTVALPSSYGTLLRSRRGLDHTALCGWPASHTHGRMGCATCKWSIPVHLELETFRVWNLEKGPLTSL